MSIHGILNINKPQGITSRQVVDRVRRIFGMPKAGHGGTLDPDATGVLLICLGKATKLFEALQAGGKEYEGALTLGVTTDTLDASGKVIQRNDISSVTEEQIISAFKKFEGEIEQIPPMFSAIKHKGKPLYKLARKGIKVKRAPRIVTIHHLKVVQIDKPEVKFRVSCSKGTYIRVLASDIGNTISCGAHLSSLTRTRSGIFTLSDAISLDEIESRPEKAYQAVHSVDDVLKALNQYNA
jgi:tRNA pseudouridine55 synthase